MKILPVLMALLPLAGGAQQVGIGTNNPNINAALDISSSQAGLLIPRLSLTATNAALPLSQHVAGMLVYNTATAGSGSVAVSPGFYYNNGSGWQRAGGWGLTGNTVSGTSSFLGTIDNFPLNFKVNGQKAGTIDPTRQNVFLGYLSGNASTNGQNVAIGDSAMAKETTGFWNTAVGARALENSVGTFNNTAVGTFALASNTTGKSNTAIGSGALQNNAASSFNVAVGQTALFSNISGVHNTALGTGALYSNDAQGNTATGYNSLYSNVAGGFNTANGWFSLNTNQSGVWNTALGASSLRLNKSGSYNVALGNNAMRLDSTGGYNTAVGVQALYSSNGEGNTAIGYQALYNDTSSDNTAVGYQSLLSNTSGHELVAVGYQSLASNTSGFLNTATGSYALAANTTGYGNTANGTGALYMNVDGSGNTAMGDSALLNSQGNTNTAVGHQAGNNLTTGNNNILIGYNAQVPANTGSNQVRIGDNNITYAGIQVAWTITSDERWKRNIRNAELGLDFIKQLHPVSYTRNNDNSGREEFGFIAQEVENALRAAGVTHSGVISKDDAGMYSMRYNDLLAPMVKAMQEQQALISKQGAEIEALKRMVYELMKK